VLDVYHWHTSPTPSRAGPASRARPGCRSDAARHRTGGPHRRESADIWTLEIEPAAGFDFLPGQFNMLYAHGVGEAAISISGDPADRARLIHTIRAVGKVSEALTRLKPGDPIGVRGPYGRGWPVEEAAGSDVVIIRRRPRPGAAQPAIYRFLPSVRASAGFVLLVGMRAPTISSSCRSRALAAAARHRSRRHRRSRRRRLARQCRRGHHAHPTRHLRSLPTVALICGRVMMRFHCRPSPPASRPARCTSRWSAT
jgi:hypothetical protein